jgi:hypothetical protein
MRLNYEQASSENTCHPPASHDPTYILCSHVRLATTNLIIITLMLIYSNWPAMILWAKATSLTTMALNNNNDYWLAMDLNDVDTSWPIPPADGWLAMILQGFCMSRAMVLHEKWLKGLHTIIRAPTFKFLCTLTNHRQCIAHSTHPCKPAYPLKSVVCRSWIAALWPFCALLSLCFDISC